MSSQDDLPSVIGDIGAPFGDVLSAAKGGDAQAAFTVGCYYKIGHQVPTDLQQARYWWRRSADQGFGPAFTQLAVMYERGLGGERDIRAALSCLESAADLGIAEAQRYLGRLYWDGTYVAADAPRAIEYWEAAAAQGDARASYNLARALWWGIGTRRNRFRALRLIYAATGDQAGVARIKSGHDYLLGIRRGSIVLALIALVALLAVLALR